MPLYHMGSPVTPGTPLASLVYPAEVTTKPAPKRKPKAPKDAKVPS